MGGAGRRTAARRIALHLEPQPLHGGDHGLKLCGLEPLGRAGSGDRLQQGAIVLIIQAQFAAANVHQGKQTLGIRLHGGLRSSGRG